MKPQLFRIRIILRLKRDTHLHAHHAAVIHALIASAWGTGSDCESHMPDGVWLDAPEQCRIRIAAGESYAFGFTMIGSAASDALSRIQRLHDGLRRVGRAKAPAKTVLGGNFEVIQIEDLVAAKTLRANQSPAPVPVDRIEREFQSVKDCSKLTLRFHSPLLAERPRNLRVEGHQFFDRLWFGAPVFLNRLGQRLVQLGLIKELSLNDNSSPPVASRNELIWLDFSYSHRDTRKAKHGAVGRVQFTELGPELVRALVWGQYSRVGGATRFGFGQYRIEELGPCPFVCRRAKPLIELALSEPGLERLADEMELPSGLIRQSANEIRRGTYHPEPHFRVETVSGTGHTRTLTIPSLRDRALQRSVLELLAPALDKFLEESSLAYRQGFGVQRAAARLRTAIQQGFEWALKADCFQFSEQWEMSPLLEPVRVRDLGWTKKTPASTGTKFASLPGESQVAETADSTIICGPNVSRLDCQGRRLLVEYSDGSRTTSLPLERLRELVLIDTPDLSRGALRAMTQHNISWYLIDSFGNPRGSFVVNDPLETHESIMAQAEGSVDPKLCLAIARKLVSAKLRNHAALARSIPGKYRDFSSADKLRGFAVDADNAQLIEELLGIEGSGAARWYGHLGGRLSGGFTFERRVAPAAHDPVNALLNVGQTVLHHLVTQMIQLVGLVPAIGFMHVPRAGHATLASDLQEPFRHLVDRAVIETLGSLRQHDFVADPDGPYRLRIQPRAMKAILRNLHLILGLNCHGIGQSIAKPYRMQILTQIRSLRLLLINPQQNTFKPFMHP